MRAFALAVLLALTSVACGTNRPDIPPELLQNSSSGGGPSGYPTGPYTDNFQADVGLVVPNLTFDQGWMDPVAAGNDIAQLAPISFADFYDPDGTKGYEVMLINTAAIWCSACKAEHGGTSKSASLNDHYAELKPRGFVILSLLFEDGQNNPAAPQDLQNWANGYDTAFPFAIDPYYMMDVFGAPKSLAPLNLVVDLRTMKLLVGYTGDQSEQIWPFIEQTLDAHEQQ